jgi:hypothetical protein
VTTHTPEVALSPTITADQLGRDLVIRHLRGLGSLPAEQGIALPLGISGVHLRPDGAITVDGHSLVCTDRRLSSLLGDSADRRLSGLLRHGTDFRYLADPETTNALYQCGQDPVLYRTIRRFLPSRSLTSHELMVAGTDDHRPGHMLADLVVYQPGRLPGGEPYRSMGHWNLSGQLEIFGVLTGRIAMLVAGRTHSGDRFSYVQICDAGTTMAVPFDVWHVTYVLDGPAVVLKVTTRLHEIDLTPAAVKHDRGAGVDMTLRWEPNLRVVGTAKAWRDWGVPAGPPRDDWFNPLLEPGQSLADLHLYGSPSQFAAIVAAAREAHREGWPLGGLLGPDVR